MNDRSDYNEAVTAALRGAARDLAKWAAACPDGPEARGLEEASERLRRCADKVGTR